MVTEKMAWLAFILDCLIFLGNVKGKNCKELVEDLLNTYQTMRCNMSLTIHFFIFPLGLLSYEPGHSE
jgi:hypothetical protein